MFQYVRCLKATGELVGDGLESKPVNRPHTLVFWVKLPLDESGGCSFPEPYCESDTVSFALTKALTATEQDAKNLIKDQSKGAWTHSMTEEEGAQALLQTELHEISQETFELIKAWCEGQPEGCEEAFINLGIANNSNARYQAYVAAKNQIIAEQHQKKETLIAEAGAA